MIQKREISILRLVEISSIVVIAAFWLFYGIISNFQRLAYDDYWEISLVNQHGVFGQPVWAFFNWGGAFFCALFQCATLYFVHSNSALLAYNLFLLAFISSTTCFMLYELARLLTIAIKPLHLLISSQFIVLALFFAGLNIPEDWFWLTGSTAYMYPVCFIFLSVAFFARFKRKAKYTDFILSCLFGVITGGAPINYVAPFSFVAVLILFVNFYRTRKIVPSDIIYVLLLLAMAAVNVLAPGNYKRLAVAIAVNAKVVHPTFIHELLTVPLDIFKHYLLHFRYVLIFCIPVAYLLTTYNFTRRISLSNLGWIFLCLMAAIYFNIIIMYKVCGDGHAEDRIYLHVTFMFLSLVILAAIFILQRMDFNKYAGIASILLLVAGMYYIVRTLQVDYPLDKHYAIAEDERMIIIQNAKSVYKKPVLYLAPLPKPGMIYSAEITEDTSNWKNIPMRDYFNLPFAVAVKW